MMSMGSLRAVGIVMNLIADLRNVARFLTILTDDSFVRTKRYGFATRRGSLRAFALTTFEVVMFSLVSNIWGSDRNVKRVIEFEIVIKGSQ